MGSIGVFRYGVVSYEDVDLAEEHRERAALRAAEADDRAAIMATRQPLVERIVAAAEMPEEAPELLDEAIALLQQAKLRAYARLATRDSLKANGCTTHG